MAAVGTVDVVDLSSRRLKDGNEFEGAVGRHDGVLSAGCEGSGHGETFGMKAGASGLVFGASGGDGAAVGSGDGFSEAFVLQHVHCSVEAAEPVDSLRMQGRKDGRRSSSHGTARDERAPDFAAGLHFIQNL